MILKKKMKIKNSKIEFLNLGIQPFANAFLKKNEIFNKERKYRLSVCFDKKTKLVSIKKTFSSQKMFNNKYPYRSSISKTVKKTFTSLAKKIKKKIKPKKILEIGCNDGSFLKNFNKKRTVGIEPCSNIEKITKKKGYNTFAKYWNKNTAIKILNKFGKFDLIYSANTISHIKDLDNVFRNINLVLKDTGVLIIEDPSLMECLKKNTYDQFYNEHIYVFSFIALNNVLKKNILEIYKVENLSIHGGSNRFYIKKKINKKKIEKSSHNQYKKEKKYGIDKIKSYYAFKKRVKKSKKKLISLFKKIKLQKKNIIGYGATAKSATILNYCDINNYYIDYFLDTTPDKHNKYTPGTKIIIKKYENKIENDVDYVFLGAWNFKNEIFQKEKKFIARGGKFITHTPFPKII
jgi:methylation protein EvaC